MEDKGFEIRCKVCGCNRVTFSEHKEFDDVSDADTYITCNGCGNREKR